MVEQRGIEPLTSALRTTKFKFYGPPKKHASFVISPNKNAAANKISSVMNYDRERPLLTKFGNGNFSPTIFAIDGVIASHAASPECKDL